MINSKIHKTVLGKIQLYETFISLFFKSYKDCLFIFASRCAHIHNTTNCTVHLATPLSPFISGATEGLKLGPYHIFYKLLSEDLSKAGIAASPNNWDSPVFSKSEYSESFSFVTADEFYYFALPFELDQDNSKRNFFFPLPKKYNTAISEKDDTQKTRKALIKVNTIFAQDFNLGK